MAKNGPSGRIWIRSVKKNPPDLSKIGRALIALAMAQAEAEAEAHAAEQAKSSDATRPHPEDAS